MVTKAPPEVGTELGDGQIVAEVSGRPVFALQGDLPVFRTLTTGVIGDDVEQLEAALARLGFNPGPVDGTFDASTATAVSSFYTNAGYPTFGANQGSNGCAHLSSRGSYLGVALASGGRESCEGGVKAVKDLQEAQPWKTPWPAQRQTWNGRELARRVRQSRLRLRSPR